MAKGLRLGGSVKATGLRLGLFAVVLPTLACSVHVDLPDVPAHHPAHPDAEAAPLPPPSPLLDSYRPAEERVEPTPAGGMEHEGHSTEDHSMHHGDGHGGEPDEEGAHGDEAHGAEVDEGQEPATHEHHHGSEGHGHGFEEGG